jgi:branched-chain amino acid transport system substrate-binding protein
MSAFTDKDPRNNPEAAPLVKKFKAAGIEPEGYVLYSYAALQVFEQAATQAGSTDYKKVLKVMKKR